MDLDFGKLKTVSLGAAALDDPGYFVLPPVPNSLFTRDSSCWIFNGVSVNPMYWPARRRESLNLLAIYRFHPMFQAPASNTGTRNWGTTVASTPRTSASLRWRGAM